MNLAQVTAAMLQNANYAASVQLMNTLNGMLTETSTVAGIKTFVAGYGS